MKSKYLYYVRSCDAVTIDLCEDIAEARALARKFSAAIFRLDTETGYMARAI